MKKLKEITAAALSVAMLLAATACNNQGSSSEGSNNSKAAGADSQDAEVTVTIPTYLTGENVGAVFFEPHIERFNQKYKGKYKINLEEITQDNYAEKIKQLAIQDKLPVLVHAPGSGGIDQQWFDEVIVKNNKAYDLTDWLEHTPVKDNYIPNSIKKCTINGKVLVQPSPIIKPIGIFYNSSMYNPDKPLKDMTYEEFFDSLGDNKIALQTGENAWVSGLLVSGMIASKEGGVELLNSHAEDKLYDYTDPVIVESFAELKDVFDKHAASNSVGAAYAEAANAFMSKNAALIVNGSWMTGDFEEGSSDKWSNGFDGKDVKYSLLPENITIANDEAYGRFWIPSTVTDAEAQLALAYLEFCDSQEEVEAILLAEGGVAPNMEYSEEFLAKQKEHPITYDFVSQIDENTVFSENILTVMPASVADSEFGKLLPKLLDGSLTAEEFCQELSAKAEASRQ